MGMTRVFCILLWIFLFIITAHGGASSSPAAASSAIVSKLIESGKYTALFPKFNRDNIDQSQLVISPKILQTLKDEIELSEMIVPLSPAISRNNTLNIHSILHKLLEISRDNKDKKVRVSLTKGLVISSIAYWPFGWRHFPMMFSKPIGNTIIASTVGLDPKEMLKIVSKVYINKEKQLIVKTVVKSKGVSKKDAKLIGESVSQLITQLLSQQYEMALSRDTLLKEYSSLSSLHQESKKKLKLDKIINPDKYKSKSPTVRRPGSSGSGNGNGRYTPSAATQARRQVRRS